MTHGLAKVARIWKRIATEPVTWAQLVIFMLVSALAPRIVRHVDGAWFDYTVISATVAVVAAVTWLELRRMRTAR